MTDSPGQDTMTEAAEMETGGAGVFRSRDRTRDLPDSELLHLVVVPLSRQVTNLTVSTLTFSGSRCSVPSLTRGSQVPEPGVGHWRTPLGGLNAATLVNIQEPGVAGVAELVGRFSLSVTSPKILSNDLQSFLTNPPQGQLAHADAT